MFHVIFSLTSRFLYLRNILQGFARGILALRSLDAISSRLAPTLSPPPPVPLLGAPVPFLERPEQIISPYPSRDVIAIESQFPVFASPFPIYQSSLIAVTPNQFPKYLLVLVFLAVISGFLVILPEIAYFFMNIVKMPSTVTHASSYIAKPFKFKPMFYCQPTSLPSRFATSKLPISLISLLLLWTGPPAIATLFTSVWFMSILFSYEPVSNTIVAILQWCGLLIVQDTRTPPLLDAIYEQITRGAAGYSDLVWCSDLSDEHNEYQVITDYSLGYSHLATQLSAHELDLQNTPKPGKNQEPEVSVQRIHTESVDSQNLHRELELSRAREQKLDADLLASEQEREKLELLVSALEDSHRNKQGWKEIAGVAKSLYLESEVIISNLRVDLAAATDRVRNIQKQLDHQIDLASDKDSIIQSITKESRLAQIRLRIAKYKVECSDVKLQEERDRRIRERKETLREKTMIQDRYDSEMRRLTQEALDAQEQLDALRHTLSQLRPDRQPPSNCDHPTRYQPPTTWPYDSGRPPLPPEWNLDTGTPPVDPDSSHRSSKWSSRSPIEDPVDSSTRLATRLLEIPGFRDQESEVAKEQRVAPTGLVEHQVKSESAGGVKPNEGDVTRLQEELITTKEHLCQAEEDVRDLRRDLGQSRESLREVETHVSALEYEFDLCRATVREAQDAQHASEVKFTEATQLVRVHQAESESSTARAKESQFKCYQVEFLCAALRERVTELEAKIKKLSNSRKYGAKSKSRSRHPTGTCTDLEAVAHDPGIQEFDSIYMTVPSSMPRLLDLPLPPSSSPSNDNSLYLSNQECPTIPLVLVSADSGSCCPTKRDPEREANTHVADEQTFDPSFMTSPQCFPCLLDLPSPPSLSQSSTSSFCFSRQMRPATPPTCTDSHSSSKDIDLHVTTPDTDSRILDSPLPPQASTDLCHILQSENFLPPPFPLPRTFLSERNGLDSVDWPPTGSSLLPKGENAPQDDNIFLTSPTKETGNESNFLCRKVLSPIKELDELEVLERHTSLDRDRSTVSDDDRKFWGLSERNRTPDAPPVWILSSPRFRPLRRQVDIPVTPQREAIITHSSPASRDRVSELVPPSRIVDLPLPVFPRITLPRFSLSPSGIQKVLERRLTSSKPGSDHSDMEAASAAPDPLLDEASSLHRGALSMSPTERRLSRKNQDVCRAVPAHHERLNPLGTAGPTGAISSRTLLNTFSSPVHPPGVSSALDCQDVQGSSPSVLVLEAQPGRTTQPDSLTITLSIPAYPENRDRPMAGSRHKGIDPESGTSSRRIALGSLPSRLHTSSDKSTSMRARRRRRGPVSKSSSARPDLACLAPEPFLSSSDDLPSTTSRSSGLPLSQISNIPDVLLACKDAKTQIGKRISKSIPRSPPSRLVQESLDQPSIQSDDASLDEGGPPRASGKEHKGRHLNGPSGHRIFSCPRDTSSPDGFIIGNSVSNVRHAALEIQDLDFGPGDFEFFIPPDCPTSTPTASRKCSAGSGMAAPLVSTPCGRGQE